MMNEGNHTCGRRKKNKDASKSASVADEETAKEDEGLGRLRRNVKRLVQGAKELRHLGIEEIVVPLPKIVVVGDQSTGKSSLIEGLSEIKVPRAEGTCTRCPLEINLTEDPSVDAKWRCEVTLLKKYLFDNKTRQAGASKTRPLGPWVAQDPYEIPFCTTHDRADVADILYSAQSATLNPSCAPEDFIPNLKQEHSVPENPQVEFSPNVVRLDISGPGLPNLSFYDLPGVIAVAEREKDQYLIGLVRNLVKEYVKADSCLILLALPMNADAANSNAVSIIKEMKALNRTVGVITKPDCVPAGTSPKHWRAVLNGDKYQVGHCYFVVKNNPDPTVDHATARAQEAYFFANEEPWKIDLVKYKSRFGIPELQKSLSIKLTRQIGKCLPKFRHQIKEKRAKVDAELNLLPKPPAGNLPLVIDKVLSTFSRKVLRHIDGGSPEFPFRTSWHAKIMELRKSLDMTRPILVLPSVQSSIHGEVSGSKKPDNRTVIELDDGPETPVRTPTRKRPHLNSVTSTPSSKRLRAMSEIPLHAEDGLEQGVTSEAAKRFSLHGIRDIIEKGYISLPGQVDPRILERMIIQSLTHWDDILENFLASTNLLCEVLVYDCFSEAFAPQRQTHLYGVVTDLCGSFLNEVMDQQKVAAQRALQNERYKPTTYNEEALERARKAALEDLQQKRRTNRAIKELQKQEEASGKQATGPARTDKLTKIGDSLSPDPFTQEIRAMSSVRAYYECAFSRFVDNIGLSVQREMFAKLRNELKRWLVEKLGIEAANGEEQCAKLLAIDPAVEERRAQLKREQDTLQKADDVLRKLLAETEDYEGPDEVNEVDELESTVSYSDETEF